MTEKFKILGQYIKDMSSETPDTETYIFVKEIDIWEQKQKLIANDGSQDDYFGQSISIENGTILIGAPYADDDSNSDSGSSYFYTIPQIDIVEEQVPAMSGIGLLALGLSMLGLGAVRLRKI